MTCSVLLPVYNAGPPLRVAIESILRQDERDFEFIAIDDRSSDDSAQIIREYMQQDPRIRGIFHEKNLGLANTLNHGLEQARTELVVRMDQDDEALPHRIRNLIGYMRSHSDTVVAGSYVYHMGRTLEQDHLITLPTEHEDIVKALPSGNCLYHPSVIMRREEILKLGGYRAEFRNAEDYDLWLRVGRVYRLANVPIPLLRYRFSTTGMTLGKKWQQMLYVQMAVVAYRDPSLNGEKLLQCAEEALAKIDREEFLGIVARGTIEELGRLHLWKDALKVLLLFSKQLDFRRSARLAMDSARSILAQYRNSGRP
jgi:glycosyltransferase involved in cell wall biosynthesis